MAGETWRSHKITGREAAWDADHAAQLSDLGAAEVESNTCSAGGCTCADCMWLGEALATGGYSTATG